MPQLFKRSCPVRKTDAPVADKVPMVDEGKLAKSPVPVSVAKKAETKTKSVCFKLEKKASRAKTFFTILTTVMFFTFLFSQASALISCAKTALDQVQKKADAPALSTSNALDEESEMNQSYVMSPPTQMDKTGAKPVAPPPASKKMGPDSGKDPDSRGPSNESMR